MADLVAINQFPVAIRASQGPQVRRMPIGSERVAFDGTLIRQRRAFKRSWRLRSTLMSEENAYALTRLLQGEGHHWDFAAASGYLYSSKGLGNESGSATRTGSGGKFGAYITIAATSEVVWDTDVEDYTDSTIMVWYYTGGAWHHYIVRGDGAKWVDGVRNDGASTPFISITSNGKAHLGDTASGSTQDFDDLVVLPFKISADMAEVFGVSTAAFSDLPELTLTGDIVPGTSATVMAVGDVSATLTQGVFDGSWAQNVYELEFELREA